MACSNLNNKIINTSRIIKRDNNICIYTYYENELYKPSCNDNEDDFIDYLALRHFRYCPYCGKLIKFERYE